MKQRPQFLTYKAPDGSDSMLVVDYLAGAQSMRREGDVFGVVVVAAGGASMVIHDVLTEEQAQALIEYLKMLMVPATTNPGSSTNVNKLVNRIKGELPDKQLIVPDDNVLPIR